MSPAGAFGPSQLHLGGPVTKHLLHILHGRHDVEGCVEVVEGVYAGGVEGATALVQAGAAQPGEFQMLAGYSGWGPGQLRSELDDGTWWCVAASPALLLECIRECAGSWQGEARGHEALKKHGLQQGLDARRQCWERVLGAAGIDHQAPRL
jgi:putative AlgH/UPF0301 family transcriptional regulator